MRLLTPRPSLVVKFEVIHQALGECERIWLIPDLIIPDQPIHRTPGGCGSTETRPADLFMVYLAGVNAFDFSPTHP